MNLKDNKCFAHTAAIAAATNLVATGIPGGLSNDLPVLNALLNPDASFDVLP